MRLTNIIITLYISNIGCLNKSSPGHHSNVNCFHCNWCYQICDFETHPGTTHYQFPSTHSRLPDLWFRATHLGTTPMLIVSIATCADCSASESEPGLHTQHCMPVTCFHTCAAGVVCCSAELSAVFNTEVGGEFPSDLVSQSEAGFHVAESFAE